MEEPNPWRAVGHGPSRQDPLDFQQEASVVAPAGVAAAVADGRRTWESVGVQEVDVPAGVRADRRRVGPGAAAPEEEQLPWYVPAVERVTCTPTILQPDDMESYHVRGDRQGFEPPDDEQILAGHHEVAGDGLLGPSDSTEHAGGGSASASHRQHAIIGDHQLVVIDNLGGREDAEAPEVAAPVVHQVLHGSEPILVRGDHLVSP